MWELLDTHAHIQLQAEASVYRNLCIIRNHINLPLSLSLLEYSGLKPSGADLFRTPLYNEEEIGEKSLEEETRERLRGASFLTPTFIF